MSHTKRRWLVGIVGGLLIGGLGLLLIVVFHRPDASIRWVTYIFGVTVMGVTAGLVGSGVVRHRKDSP